MTFEREYEEVDFNAPIVKWSEITVREFLDMSDVKRKELIAALEVNASPEMKERIANERKYLEKSKNTVKSLLKVMDIQKPE